jgi:hypothetical protein
MYGLMHVITAGRGLIPPYILEDMVVHLWCEICDFDYLISKH